MNLIMSGVIADFLHRMKAGEGNEGRYLVLALYVGDIANRLHWDLSANRL
jgi:hypothetical protein